MYRTSERMDNLIKKAIFLSICLVVYGLTYWIYTAATISVPKESEFKWNHHPKPEPTFHDIGPTRPIPLTAKDQWSHEYWQASIVGYIAFEAMNVGVDPVKALQIAQCESNYNQFAKSKQSSAKGLFQIIDKTFSTYCAGDVFKIEDNVACFLKLYPKNKSWWVCK